MGNGRSICIALPMNEDRVIQAESSTDYGDIARIWISLLMVA